ncbi:MAG: cyclopropane fatty acyl phospholipid synthase [Terrimicrobiaceae bacterium]|nr:cyclopropane fatty acyl phospholipid synthase [Terrimicrobiaceae bacterium]
MTQKHAVGMDALESGSEMTNRSPATKCSLAKQSLREILAAADIVVDGSRPWDLRIHNDRFYSRVMAEGTLGLGESYMEGWWDCEALDEMCCRGIRARFEERLPFHFKTMVSIAATRAFNFQTRRRARRVGEVHYDLGNDFFAAMLDPSMQYSCAYFRDTSDLAEAQQLKLDLICRKLGLQAGMRLLDIGCGWGGLAAYAARRHGCQVVGITISREQQACAEAACRGLPVEIRLQDYRDVRESFDRIVSVGMMEHVGYKNYRAYLGTARRCLKDGGLFLCQTIGGDRSRTDTDPWITRYIFPNSMLPSATQVAKAAEGELVLEDVQNFGADYDRTLLAWHKNFSESWGRFSGRYGETFRRMWRFYLLGCAGAFRARSLQLFQFLFSKGGIEGGCSPVR